MSTVAERAPGRVEERTPGPGRFRAGRMLVPTLAWIAAAHASVSAAAHRRIVPQGRGIASGPAIAGTCPLVVGAACR